MLCPKLIPQEKYKQENYFSCINDEVINICILFFFFHNEDGYTLIWIWTVSANLNQPLPGEFVIDVAGECKQFTFSLPMNLFNEFLLLDVEFFF